MGEKKTESKPTEETIRPDLNLARKEGTKKFQVSKQAENEALALLKQANMPLEMRASEHQLEEFYEIAYNLYRSGNFQDALPMVQILALARPQEFKYVFTIAACYHMLKQYEEAIPYYVFCALLDPKDPLPHYHEADCWLHLQETSGAWLALYMGIKKARDSKQYYALYDRMVSMQNKLKAEFEEKAKLGVYNFRGTAGQEEMAKLGDLAALEAMLKESENAA